MTLTDADRRRIQANERVEIQAEDGIRVVFQRSCFDRGGLRSRPGYSSVWVRPDELTGGRRRFGDGALVNVRTDALNDSLAAEV